MASIYGLCGKHLFFIAGFHWFSLRTLHSSVSAILAKKTFLFQLLPLSASASTPSTFAQFDLNQQNKAILELILVSKSVPLRQITSFKIVGSWL